MTVLFLATLLVSSALYAEPVQWPVGSGGNDHWYELVVHDTSLTWYEMRDLAEQYLLFGIPGHLVTLTSSEENSWVWDNLNPGTAIIGAFQEPGSAEPDLDWQWVTGEEWVYSGWCGSEPNDTGGVEDAATFTTWSPDGCWNDGDGNVPSTLSYIVEWDHMAVDSKLTSWSSIKAFYN